MRKRLLRVGEALAVFANHVLFYVSFPFAVIGFAFVGAVEWCGKQFDALLDASERKRSNGKTVDQLLLENRALWEAVHAIGYAALLGGDGPKCAGTMPDATCRAALSAEYWCGYCRCASLIEKQARGERID